MDHIEPLVHLGKQMCPIIQSIMFVERVLLDQEIGALDLFLPCLFRIELISLVTVT